MTRTQKGAGLLLALLVCAAVACTRSPSRRAQQFISSGDRYAAAGDLASAAIQYRNAIKVAPSLVEGHTRLLDVATRRHDRETATQETFALADLAPNDATWAIRAGDLYLLQGRLAEAEQAFRQAVRVDAASAAPHRGLAILYMRQQHLDQAEREWEAVARSRDGDPFAVADFHLLQGRLDQAEADLRGLLGGANRAGAQLRLARVLQREGHTAAADELLDSVIKADRHNAIPWIVRGQLRLAAHRPDDAARAFEAALQADPTSLEALTGVTALDLDAKRADRAVARVERTLAASPDAVPLLLLAGRTYGAIGQYDKAEARLTRAIQDAPSAAGAYTLLSAVYVREGRLAEARAAFTRLVERQPGNVPAMTMIGLLYEAEGRPDDAKATYERVLAKFPRAGVAANNLACLDARQGRLDDALEYAQVARQELGRLPQASDTLGWIYVQRKQPNDALPLLAEAAERQPENPLYHFHLGMAYADTGAVVQASDELGQALASSQPFDGRELAMRRKAEVDQAVASRQP